jgi:hypothetical protein
MGVGDYSLSMFFDPGLPDWEVPEVSVLDGSRSIGSFISAAGHNHLLLEEVNASD